MTTEHIQENLRLRRFIWADKASLVVGFLLSLFLLCFWSLAFLVVGSLGAAHLWGNFGIPGFELAILIVGSAWFALRLTDFLAGGATYQLFGHKTVPNDADLCMPPSAEPNDLPIDGVKSSPIAIALIRNDEFDCVSSMCDRGCPKQ